MRRPLLAAVTGLVLALSPTVASAQEADETPATEEPTVLDALAEAVGGWAQALLDGRDAVADPDADADAADAFEELVDGLQAAVSDVFGALVFQTMASEALADAEEAEGADGAAVSTVAQCAPRGSFKALLEGAANHGAYVTAAAHGETVGLFVPTVETDPDAGDVTVVPATEATEFDLSDVAGAEALCDALAVVYQARLLELELAWEDVDVSRDARALAREQCRIERLLARDGGGDAADACAELRARVKELHEQERAERAAERDERRADRADERDQRKADRAAEREARREARQGS